MFSLICVWINGWINNREAGDLRRYRAHSDVIVMLRDDTKLLPEPMLTYRLYCLIAFIWGHYHGSEDTKYEIENLIFKIASRSPSDKWVKHVKGILIILIRLDVTHKSRVSRSIVQTVRAIVCHALGEGRARNKHVIPLIVRIHHRRYIFVLLLSLFSRHALPSKCQEILRGRAHHSRQRYLIEQNLSQMRFK